jgi:hypothetical protein
MPAGVLSLNKLNGDRREDETPRVFVARHATGPSPAVYVGRTWGGLARHPLCNSKQNLAGFIRAVRNEPERSEAFAALRSLDKTTGGKVRVICWCERWAINERRCHAGVLDEMLTDGADNDALERFYDDQYARMKRVEEELRAALKRKRVEDA